ncbi:ABC transporter ATP-binding protein [Chloroflexi bacterium TSY]|nr:ABC transporter ATP-binding protein [Chloroflexi bacterium TSY]
MALLGPSGCGKTTTLRLLAGFERLESGTIEMHGEVVAAPGIHVPPEKRSIGMVFQEYALFPHLSVAENVRFGLHTYDKDKEHRVQEVLEMVGLSRLGKRMPHELSGGQQQRVALARALAPEPHLILLDEPFSNLDASLRARVRSDVRSILKQAEATAIFVTHDQEEALSLVDQVTVLMNGKVQQIATPHTLYYRPATPEVASFVGEANFLPGFAYGETVECAFGTLPTISPMTGPVKVMIRPENVLIYPSDSETGYCITDVIFYGHDQLLAIQFNEYILQSRIVGTQYHFRPGQPVSIEVNGPVMAYS